MVDITQQDFQDAADMVEAQTTPQDAPESEGMTESEAVDALAQKFIDDGQFPSEESAEPEFNELEIGEGETQHDHTPQYDGIQVAYQQFASDVEQFKQDYYATNWNQLRDEDAGEYAARLQEVNARRSELAQREQQIQQAVALEQQSEQINRQKQQVEHFAKEEQQVLQAIPSWNDPKVRQRELVAIRKHLNDRGVSDGKIDRMSSEEILYVYKTMQELQGGKPKRKTLLKKKAKPRAQKLKARPGMNESEAADILGDYWRKTNYI